MKKYLLILTLFLVNLSFGQLNYYKFLYGDKQPTHYKVLYKDGTVKVVDIRKTPLQTLSKNPDVVYIEPPRKLQLLEVKTDPVAPYSAIGVSGTGNQTLTLKTYSGEKINILKYPSNISLNVSGSCSPSSNGYTCNDGNLTIKVKAFSDWRVIITSPNKVLSTADLSGSYYLGTNASTTGKTGKNVLIGVIDTGIDFCHPLFLKPDGTSKILYYYEPSTKTEFDRNTINQKIKNKDCNYDYEGHGSHVAGIATMIAPDADLVIVKTNFYDTDVIQGLEYLKKKQQNLNKPMVVNMSLGFYGGPHDGTSLLERKIQELTLNGFVVVVAAGNEGNKPIHSQVIGLNSKVSVNLSSNTGDLIDGWYRCGKIKVEFCDSNNKCISANSGSKKSGTLGNCRVVIDNTRTSSSLNGDGEFVIDFDNFNCTGNFTVNLYPESGSPTVDIYFADFFGDSEFLNYTQTDIYGGYLGTVTMPATSPYVVSVGALTSKPFDETSLIDLGKIAVFSSRGPTRDGRIKPDITAPGYWVLSAKAGSNDYIEMRGTSMATPVVTGIVAQLLENNPNLDVFQVKSLLK
ncbi:MAG: S8 family serine peptidase, partial [Sulfurihydrogenibium sp.]|uniref:S8 family serine peptidase n=1 Tax=Sulfurihydrogenibium sp. TaxID=2053621 RepID=UPI003C7BCDD1